MPMVADEEWINAVMKAAVSTQAIKPPKVCALSVEMTDITSGIARSGFKPPVIRFRP